MNVAVIGLGNIGAPIAWRLIDRGHAVEAHDSRPEAMVPFGKRAVTAIGAITAEVVVLSLPSPAAVLAVAPRLVGRVVVDTSTCGVAASREVAGLLGEAFVDCPVSGGADGAAAGTLTLMAAGSAATIAAVRPVLDDLGTVHLVGDTAGMGQAVKLANNVLSATIFAATIEALAVAARAGVDPAIASRVIDSGTGRSDSTAKKVPNDVLTGAFSAPFTLDLMTKDVHLFADLAVDLPIDVCRAGIATLDAGVAAGLGPEAFTALARLIEDRFGVRLRRSG